MAEWYFAKGEQRKGPLSSAELKRLATSGELQPDDLIWKEGLKEWQPARNVKGLFAAALLNATPPPLPVKTTTQLAIPAQPSRSKRASPTDASPISEPTTDSAPPLWNPRAASVLSIIFSWAFGAFLISRNWKSLGEDARAKRSMYWFYSFFAFLVLAVLTPDSPAITKVFQFVGMCCLAAWATLDANPQVKFVKERFGNDYPRKSWMKPIAIALPIFVVTVISVGIGMVAAIENQNVNLVKQGTLNAYPEIKLGNVIDSFFQDPKWEAIVSDNGEHYVNASGGMMYMNKPVTGKLQFRIVGQTFEFTAFELNGIPQNNLIKNVLVQKMYEKHRK